MITSHEMSGEGLRASALSVPQESPARPEFGLIGRTLYGASYCLSFGVMFPVRFVGSFMPQQCAMTQGLRDGGHAASEANERLKAGTVELARKTCDKVGGAYANVAARVTERIESVQDSIAERRYRQRTASA